MRANPLFPHKGCFMAVDEQALRNLLRQGFNALGAGNIPLASRCCQQALAIKPDLPQAHFLVGLTALQAQDRQTAFQAFGSVTTLDPMHAAAWAQLARLFMTEGQVARADAALANAVKAGSKDPMVHDLVGTVYSLIGEYDAAQRSFEAAVERQPEHPPFLLNLANNRVYHGDTDAAISIIDRLLALQPNSPQAHWVLSGTRRAEDDQHIQAMQQILTSEALPPRASAFYYYAIGKEYEDLQQWQQAFAAFERGATLRRSTIEFDEPAEQAMFAFLEANFTRQWLAQVDAGSDAAGPVFVLGQPRTGTTLIERIITSHSRVESAGELQQLSLAVRRLSDYRDPKRFSTEFFQAAMTLDPKRLGELYLDTTRKQRGKAEFFVDKLPQNYLMVPLILAALPQAKIVHVQRSPMDACFASYKQLFADAYLHSYDQREMARHHARYRHLMDVWRTRFGDRFIDISYEATVQDLEPQARRLIDFLGLDWEPACLDFHAQTSAVSTASAVQVREPAHTRSVDRWRRYENQLDPMLAELKAQNIETDI
jgi:tetratricopeptide (TPR) repeat protein